MSDPNFSDWFAKLRGKWFVVPGEGPTRYDTTQLALLSDDELLAFWKHSHEEETTGARFCVRGWYHTLYKDVLRGKRVIDVGSGLGYDALSFAMAGAAHVTCADILEPNLQLLERLSSLLGVRDRMSFHYINDVASYAALPGGYDVIWAQGSLINAPFAVIQAEAHALLTKLVPGGRWIELAYPRERWERDGCPPLEDWGKKTDGPGTPYVDWYDLDKLRELLHPHTFEVVLHFNFYRDNFNWFDVKVSG